jgi:hypothetical protein
MSPQQLPPLPYPKLDSVPAFTEPGYTAEQMREYARQALAAHEAAKPAEPVGKAMHMLGTEGFTMAVFNALQVPKGAKLYAAPVVVASPWIPVSERLPEPNEFVLGFWPRPANHPPHTAEQIVAFLSADRFPERGWFSAEDCCARIPPTHWQPLLPAPEMKP